MNKNFIKRTAKLFQQMADFQSAFFLQTTNQFCGLNSLSYITILQNNSETKGSKI